MAAFSQGQTSMNGDHKHVHKVESSPREQLRMRTPRLTNRLAGVSRSIAARCSRCQRTAVDARRASSDKTNSAGTEAERSYVW